MKKTLFFMVALVLLLAACNEKSFFKKLEGNWTVDKYLFSGADKTVGFDTTYREYEMDLASDNRYAITYKQYSFAADSVILNDTTGYDSVNMAYLVNIDTIRFIDTTVTPFAQYGGWEVLNSDEDLQLRSDSDAGNPVIYRILDISKSTLNLQKGNEEYHFKKK